MAQSTTTLAYALVSVLALGLGGCYDSRAPLGPASEGFLDPALLGPWQCASAEAPDQPGDTLQLQLFRFDETQYYVSWQQGSDPPEHLRAYSSSVEDQPFLNVQWLETGPGGESGYTFVGYSFPAEG